MAMGRKPIEIDLARVEQLAAEGLSEEQIALSLGISQDTITRRKQNSAAFAEALKRGKARGIKTVANTLFRAATDPEKPNMAAAIFYLKARGQWREKADVSVEHSGSVKVDHDVTAALEALKRAGIDPSSL
jgi:transposase